MKLKIKELRIERGWSQDQLAQLTGLNIRTIQRIERGHNAGLDSLNALSSVFEVPLTTLQEPSMESDQLRVNEEQERAIEYVKDIKGFYSHLLEYLVITSALLVFNLIITPDNLWVKWVAFGWGIGVLSHAVNVFEVVNLFGPDWEKRQIKKRLERKNQ